MGPDPQFLKHFKIGYACVYLGHEYKFSVLPNLSDYVTYSTHFNIQSERSIPQFWNIVGKY